MSYICFHLVNTNVSHVCRDQGLADSEEWQRLNEIEMQVYSEMDSLKNSIKRMKDDITKFADLDRLKRECQVCTYVR